MVIPAGSLYRIAYTVVEQLREQWPVAVGLSWMSIHGDTYYCNTIRAAHDVQSLEDQDSAIWAFRIPTRKDPCPLSARAAFARCRLLPLLKIGTKSGQSKEALIRIMDLPSDEEILDLVYRSSQDKHITAFLALFSTKISSA